MLTPSLRKPPRLLKLKDLGVVNAMLGVSRKLVTLNLAKMNLETKTFRAMTPLKFHPERTVRNDPRRLKGADPKPGLDG